MLLSVANLVVFLEHLLHELLCTISGGGWFSFGIGAIRLLIYFKLRRERIFFLWFWRAKERFSRRVALSAFVSARFYVDFRFADGILGVA